MPFSEDVCIHIDGAGSIGMKYSPFYCSTIPGEPASFTALETKNTVVIARIEVIKNQAIKHLV